MIAPFTTKLRSLTSSQGLSSGCRTWMPGQAGCGASTREPSALLSGLFLGSGLAFGRLPRLLPSAEGFFPALGIFLVRSYSQYGHDTSSFCLEEKNSRLADPVRWYRMRMDASSGRRRHPCAGPKTVLQQPFSKRSYSHSIVAGGLELTSYVTRLTPATSLMIRDAMRPSNSYGSRLQSAVMKSSLSTHRMQTADS